MLTGSLNRTTCVVGFAPLLTAVPFIAISDASGVRDCSTDIRILDAAI
jgi:hypothetical protein